MRIDLDAIERSTRDGKHIDRVFPFYRQEISALILYHYNDGELKEAKTFDDPKDVIHITVLIDKPSRRT